MFSKVALLAAALIISATSLLVSDWSTAENVQPETDWQIIIGMKSDEGLAYYNTNSFMVLSEDGKSKLVSGEILIISNKERTIIIDGVAQKVKSMVTDMMVECESGLSSSVSDYFFKQEHPRRQDAPVGARSYTSPLETAFILPKSSPLYSMFCTKSI